MMETEVIDKVFQELSQITQAKTARELKLENALRRIAKWFGEFPATDRTWSPSDKTPMSYGSCFGSNGERDYMREVASQALEE